MDELKADIEASQEHLGGLNIFLESIHSHTDIQSINKNTDQLKVQNDANEEVLETKFSDRKRYCITNPI